MACIPDRSQIRTKDAIQIYGGITFSLYGPDKTDWLNRTRHIGMTNDVGGWEFAAEDTIQSYEETENYNKRTIVDRFTPEMFERDCAALGIQLLDKDFHGGQCLASHQKIGAVPGLTMSIPEVRSHLYL